MPTALRIGKLRVVIYPNDHRPAHVHIIGPESEATFFLNCPDGPPKLRESMGLDLRRLREIASLLRGELETLCRAWGILHGYY